MLLCYQSIDHFNPHILFIHSASRKQGLPSPDKIYYHQHDFFELSIILEGKSDYLIDGAHYHLVEGDIMTLNPHTYHGETPSPADNTQLHIGFSNLIIDESERPNFVHLLQSSPIIRLKKFKKEFLTCCEEIQKESKIRDVGHEFIIKTLCMKLIILLYREMMPTPLLTASNRLDFKLKDKDDVVSAIVEYMNTHYMEEISLDYISKTIYLSPVYISKIFKEEMGTSPINYLIQVRLNKAKTLLEQESLPIKTVANQVGYTDAYHFSRLFKKYFGYPPSQVVQSTNK